ncbi:phosphoglycerate mutase family protein [Rhizodiscina lignyota]|uniref:Phosphoglycerate mutase family protein n=1 Tax=Rhizodiscina lignyota TaxID=1504668 RepID=A0A9P4MGI5_9PEZI|nr:phosphoglycerate mutase family protein [Rhizodiscina lignyota]
MSAAESSTPRVFIARHGETEWSRNGRYTGVTDLPLLEDGEKQVLGTGKRLVGPGKLIEPAKVGHVFISPRQRAQSTFRLLFGDDGTSNLTSSGKVSTEEMIAEWGYGDYEGLMTDEIRALRKKRGLDQERPWDIWRDGCEGGESAQEVSDRLDALIKKIHGIQRPCMYGEKPADVVLVAHGHILRAFTKRWLKYPMDFDFSMMMPPGAIGVLSYQKHDIDDPAIWIGMALPTETE